MLLEKQKMLVASILQHSQKHFLTDQKQIPSFEPHLNCCLETLLTVYQTTNFLTRPNSKYLQTTNQMLLTL